MSSHLHNYLLQVCLECRHENRLIKNKQSVSRFTTHSSIKLYNSKYLITRNLSKQIKSKQIPCTHSNLIGNTFEICGSVCCTSHPSLNPLVWLWWLNECSPYSLTRHVPRAPHLWIYGMQLAGMTRLSDPVINLTFSYHLYMKVEHHLLFIMSYVWVAGMLRVFNYIHKEWYFALSLKYVAVWKL